MGQAASRTEPASLSRQDQKDGLGGILGLVRFAKQDAPSLLEQHVQRVIEALKPVAKELGLNP